MNDPRIPALLVSHRRPGFYFRVLEEGDVQAGRRDRQARVRPGAMTVAEVDGAPLPPRAPAPAAAPSAPDPCAQPRLASLVPRPARRRTRQRQRRPGGDQPAAGLAGLPPADRHRNRARERVSDLHPPRGHRRRAAPVGAPGAVPDGAHPARRDAAVAAAQLLALGLAGAGYYRISVKREHDGAASG